MSKENMYTKPFAFMVIGFHAILTFIVIVVKSQKEEPDWP